MVFKSLPNTTAHRLCRLATHAAHVGTPTWCAWRISTAALLVTTEPELVTRITEWEERGAFYLYRICVPSDTNLAAVERQFLRSKKRKFRGRAYARFNSPSYVFYIGSCQKCSLSTRIAQHLGYRGAATSALHLRHWTAGLRLDLTIETARYHPAPPPAFAQEMEDTLWLEQAPMFGRRGRQ